MAAIILDKIFHSIRKKIFLEKKQFKDKTTRLMNEWLHNLIIKDIAFKAIMTILSLLLQTPWQKSKSRNHLEALEQGIYQLISEEIFKWLLEGETIHKDFKSLNTSLSIPWNFQKFYSWNEHNIHNGNLSSNPTSLNQLRQKHL